MAGESHTTTDRDTIKSWTQERDGYPATVQGHSEGGEDSSVLRVAFDEENDLLRIDWDKFFRKFEAEKLAFIYQNDTADGDISRFCKLVERD